MAAAQRTTWVGKHEPPGATIKLVHRPSAATRALALIFTIVLVFAPACPPRHCAHACCPTQSNNCSSVLDQSVACLETPSAPVPSDTHNFALTVTQSQVPVTLLHASHDQTRASLILRHPSAPPPPLRI
jgi:hypothetical protein